MAAKVPAQVASFSIGGIPTADPTAINQLLFRFANQLNNWSALATSRINNTLHVDGTEPMQGPLTVQSVAKASLPQAPIGSVVWVPDANPGELIDQGNGQVWAPVSQQLHGQCRFAFESATQCVLAPWGGNALVVNGTQWPIPAGGIQTANTGVSIDGTTGNLAASTTYFVYAVVTLVNGVKTVTLEFSTTGYKFSTVFPGFAVKNVTGGDDHTLVARVATDASGNFQSSTTISWFNTTLAF